MTSLAFTVYGLPAPQGSKRHVGHGIMVESSARVKPWREDVRQAALDAMAVTPDWVPGCPAVRLFAVFSLPRPKGHLSSRNYRVLKPTAPDWHTKRPDLDKLLRSTLDALTSAGVYSDDSAVCQVQVWKVYTVGDKFLIPHTLDRPGVFLRVTTEDGLY